MELVMTKSFEDRFFEMIEDRFKRQDDGMQIQNEKLENILSQTRKTNGRVLGLEDREASTLRRIKTLEVRKGKKINIPTNILYLIAVAAVIILFIVAKLMGIKLGGLL